MRRSVCPRAGPQRYIRHRKGVNAAPAPHHRRSPSPRGSPGPTAARHQQRSAVHGLTRTPGGRRAPPAEQRPRLSPGTVPSLPARQPHPSPLSSGPARCEQAAAIAGSPRAFPGRPSPPITKRGARSAPPGRRRPTGTHHGGGWRWILRGGGVPAMAAATALSRWRAQSGRKRTLTSTAPFLYDGAGRGAEPAQPARKAHAQPPLSGPQRPVGSMVGRTVPPGRDHVAAHRGLRGAGTGSARPTTALPGGTGSTHQPQRGGSGGEGKSPPRPLPVTRVGTDMGQRRRYGHRGAVPVQAAAPPGSEQ